MTNPAADFRIQRGVATFGAGGTTLDVAIEAVDLARAWARIVSLGGNGLRSLVDGSTPGQRDAGVTPSFPDASTLRLTLDPGAQAKDGECAWEVLEYVGAPGGPNEWRVKQFAEVAMTSGQTSIAPAEAWTDATRIWVVNCGARAPGTGQTLAQQRVEVRHVTSPAQAIELRRAAPTHANQPTVAVAEIELVGSNWKVCYGSHSALPSNGAWTNPSTLYNPLAFGPPWFATVSARGAGVLNNTVANIDVGVIDFFGFALPQLRHPSSSAPGTPQPSATAYIVQNTDLQRAEVDVELVDGLTPTLTADLPFPTDPTFNTGAAILSLRSHEDENSVNYPSPFGLAYFDAAAKLIRLRRREAVNALKVLGELVWFPKVKPAGRPVFERVTIEPVVKVADIDTEPVVRAEAIATAPVVRARNIDTKPVVQVERLTTRPTVGVADID